MAKRAAQRVDLMCVAQADLRPDPRCLDGAPAGAMQLVHRESVVQFINEVRARALLPPPPRPAHASRPIASPDRAPIFPCARCTPLSSPLGTRLSRVPLSRIAQVCEDFSLQTQTAGLAVSYFDRYVSKVGEKGLCKKRVQLLAITTVLIAAKFSEIKMPGLDDLCEVAQNKYSKPELKSMELETLRVLQWELHAVTPHDALQQLAIVTNVSSETSKPFLDHAEFFIDMSYYEVRPAPRVAPPPAPLHSAPPASRCRFPPPSRLSPLTPCVPPPPSQYKSLSFPPLVIAAASLLCAWAHLGNVKALKAHLPKLGQLCRASEHDLMKCQKILQEYFNKTFPQAAEAAEKYRQAALAVNRPGTSSPDTVMAALDSPILDSARSVKALAPDAVPVDMTALCPDFCFSPAASRC